MRFNKDGTPDKRFKKEEPIIVDTTDTDDFTDVEYISDDCALDPNELLNDFLKDNGLKLDFDVVEGTIETKQGIIKLEKPTLVIKAFYV